MSGLTTREKGDIYRDKRGFYLTSAQVRGLSPENMFHLDTAFFVLQEMERVSAKPLTAITGDEFADRPPTSSGQRAFAISVAEMKKTRDTLFEGGEAGKCSLFEDPVGIRQALDQTITSFFAACGMETDGSEIKDRARIRSARESFFQSRELFADRIRTELTTRRHRMIEAFRKEKGLAETMTADPEPEDPAFAALCDQYPEAAAKNADRIHALKEKSLRAGEEAAGRRASREALFLEAKQVFFDESVDWEYRLALREAFLASSRETDTRIRDLFYTREAAVAQLKWLLSGEPADAILLERIQAPDGPVPGALDDNMLLANVPGYVHPVVNVSYPIPAVSDLELVFDRGEEIRLYLHAHPEQFEAQSLLSLATAGEGFTDCIGRAWSLSQGVDSITGTEEFQALDRECKIRLFFIWAMSNAVCRAGYTMIDWLLQYENRTVKEAVEALRILLPEICFSRQEKQSKETVGMIMMERSGFHDSEHKDRFLEHFGL